MTSSYPCTQAAPSALAFGSIARQCVALFTLGGAPLLHATDPFVSAITPCLEQLRAPADATNDIDATRYQIVLGQGWSAGLFAIADEHGGNLGTDLCGDLGTEALAFAEGRFAWPESLGERRAVELSMLTPTWLEMILREARAHNLHHNSSSSAERDRTNHKSSRSAERDRTKNKSIVQRVIITPLPDTEVTHLVRIKFAGAEAGMTVDLDINGKLLKRYAELPDEFPKATESEVANQPTVESIAAPTVDPRQALRLLLANTGAKSDAMVLRLTLSSFSAGLVYKNKVNGAIRQTEFNFIDGAASNITDQAFDFPATLKACAMSMQKVEKAVEQVSKQKRYQKAAKRLQHLLLECSDQKPTPHFSLIALEPFEYFDLPAER